MIQTLRNAWKIEEIRRKILFTLLIILLYRLGNAVPVPYVNVDLLRNYFTSVQSTVLGLMNVMSGGAFSNATIFALSIQPYINASIGNSFRQVFKNFRRRHSHIPTDKNLVAFHNLRKEKSNLINIVLCKINTINTSDVVCLKCFHSFCFKIHLSNYLFLHTQHINFLRILIELKPFVDTHSNNPVVEIL